MTRPLHVAILAGETSGDLLGAPLMQALSAQYPTIRFSGIGGAQMQAQGLESLADMARLSVMGLVEVLVHLPDIMRVKKSVLNYWQDNPPDIFIGIDAPDFNLRIAHALHQRGIPTVHYVSPSLWAWKEKRIETIKQAVDLVLCLFPFETAVYDKHQVQAVCVGHPLRDRLSPQDQQSARQQLNLPAIPPLLGIFPGSRRGEITRLLPIYLQALTRLQANIPDLQALVSVSEARHRALIDELIAPYAHLPITAYEGDSASLISAVDVALLSSGTITLECALLQTPMVVAYRVNALTALIAKRLLTIEHFSLPNLLAQRRLVPECIQREASPETIATELATLFNDEQARQAQLAGFIAISETLPYGVSQRGAEAILTLLGVNCVMPL